MTLPRSKTVLPDSPGYYHCVTRCVRRAWLCGSDSASGKNYDHRRKWIETRLLELAEVFSIGLYAYAVMSNHVHVVLHTDPTLPFTWSDEEVASRWSSLSRDLSSDRAGRPCGMKTPRHEALLLDRERLGELRLRLGSLSWFMRFLNEAIARAANREDGCTGRFWEGRFRCQYLADEDALLGCMTYVDLNPVRAGLADKPEESDFTSVRRRVDRCEHEPAAMERPIGALAGARNDQALSLNLSAYLELLRWTAHQHGSTLEVTPTSRMPNGLKSAQCSQSHWLRLTSSLESAFGAAVGARSSLRRFAATTGRKWVRGTSCAW